MDERHTIIHARRSRDVPDELFFLRRLGSVYGILSGKRTMNPSRLGMRTFGRL